MKDRARVELKPLLHRLILLSYLVFFGSMMISARSYYSGKSINLKDAVISYLLSRSDNPGGYRIATVGTALCGALLLPVAFLFYRPLATRHRALAFAGTLIFALGPLCAVSMIFLTNDINDLHVYLATAAYFFMTLGLAISIALEAAAGLKRGGLPAASLMLLLAFLLAVVLFIIYIALTPDFFDRPGLLHSVAFCEWTLCCVVAACTSGLAMMLTRPTR